MCVSLSCFSGYGILTVVPPRATKSSSAPRLEHNALYAALFEQDPENSWHWGLYLHHEHKGASGTLISGYKMHVSNEHGAWQYACLSDSVPASFALTIMAKIGAIHPDWDVQFLDEYLKVIPMSVPDIDRHVESTFTSKVWFRQAVRVLHNEQFSVKCEDVDALERELASSARIADSTTGFSSTFFEAKSARPVTPDE